MSRARAGRAERLGTLRRAQGQVLSRLAAELAPVLADAREARGRLGAPAAPTADVDVSLDALPHLDAFRAADRRARERARRDLEALEGRAATIRDEMIESLRAGRTLEIAQEALRSGR